MTSQELMQSAKLSNKEQKPVYLLTKNECISEMKQATESNERTGSIAKHFYRIASEPISVYC